MPKICYVGKKFKSDSQAMVARANQVIAEYAELGYTLTLRQLFYQFVSRDWLPNNQNSYKRLGNVLNDARLAGLVDWNSMEDRTRNLQRVSTWDSPADIVDACARQFNLDWWKDQPVYVEAFIEKDALLGILETACEPYQVPYFSCRGYPSATELWGAAQRYTRAIDDGKKVLVLHMGDHDPSGVDMTRDIRDRIMLIATHDLGLFKGDVDDDMLEVRRIALNIDQVREHNPPPNYAKPTDVRYEDYRRIFGDDCWELDALPPNTLSQLVQSEIRGVIDYVKWDSVREDQRRDRALLQQVSEQWDEVTRNLQE